MKIKAKLLLSFLVLITLSLIVGGFSYRTTSHISSEIIPILETNEAITIHMLQLRRSEKDFLARSLTDPNFFETGRSSYLKKFNDIYSTLEKEISTIESFSHNNKYRENTAKLKTLVDDYRRQFLNVVAKKKERGFKDWGTLGELREAVREVETVLQRNAYAHQELINTMLMSRRHEKDYLLRNDVEYQERLTQRLDQFLSQLNVSTFTDNEQVRIQTLIENYLTKFNALVAIDEEIGRTSSRGLMGKYRSTIHELEPLMEEQNKLLKERLNKTITQSNITLITILAVITILGILLALFLSSRISSPLRDMAEIGKKVASGNLDVAIPNVKSKDEVKDMADTMEMLTGAIKFHLNKK